MNRFISSSLLSGASAFALLFGSASAAGLPSGGHYVSGQGSIYKANQSVTVKQSSTAGIIDWNKFSISSKSGVIFDNGNGATLNRVTGGNLSRIAGSLHATGSLYLLNSSGVIVSNTGHIVTGGNFIASSGSLTNTAFNTNDRRLFNAKASVINRGTITSDGETKLVGGSVINAGIIHAADAKLYARGGEALDAGTVDATGEGAHSGRILMIATDGMTRITGQLIARNANGKSGYIETSGKVVSIAGRIDTGKYGKWLVDPKNLTIGSSAAKTIDKALNAGTDVVLKTTKTGTSGAGTVSNGPGDITINAKLNWNTSATLTLDAYHGVNVDAAVAIKNGGVIVDTAHGGVLSFDKGNIDFSNLSGKLKINGSKYTLVNSIASLATAIAGDPSGDFALAHSYDAKNDGTYSSAPIATTFTGTVEGLGNSISHFTINSADAGVGLFLDIGAGGTVADVVLTSASVTSTYSGLNGTAGGLAATNDGTIRGVSVTGTVNATGTDDGADDAQESLSVGGIAGANFSDILHSSSSAVVTANAAVGANVGGLVGFDASSGMIDSSTASGVISGLAQSAQVGGLVGTDDGAITASAAAGSVTGGDQGNYGGLVGDEVGVITGSFASGHVTCADNGALIGGLVGENDGTIERSYATGAVLGGNAASGWGLGVGGLVGYNDGVISTSYATGTTTSGDATGTGQIWVGGLVGINTVAGTGTGVINESYANGNVTGGQNTDVGGFVGVNNTNAVIDQAYSTGKVKGGSGSVLGGFVGVDGGSISSAYWDTTTSNIKNTSQGAGNPASDPGIKAKTTAQLQADLPGGFSASVWAVNSKINGGLPYLKVLKDSY